MNRIEILQNMRDKLHADKMIMLCDSTIEGNELLGEYYDVCSEVNALEDAIECLKVVKQFDKRLFK